MRAGNVTITPTYSASLLLKMALLDLCGPDAQDILT